MSDIYRAEKPWLVRFFRRELGSPNDADDLAHETMTRFLRAAPVAAIASPQAYLRRIATNLLRDRVSSGPARLARLSVPLNEGLDRATNFDPHRELEAREEMLYWAKVLEQLKPLTLEIFLLSRIEGYTYNEIKAHLGVPLWIVQRHMLKAIRHIAANRTMIDD